MQPPSLIPKPRRRHLHGALTLLIRKYDETYIHLDNWVTTEGIYASVRGTYSLCICGKCENRGTTDILTWDFHVPIVRLDSLD